MEIDSFSVDSFCEQNSRSLEFTVNSRDLLFCSQKGSKEKKSIRSTLAPKGADLPWQASTGQVESAGSPGLWSIGSWLNPRIQQ